MKVNWKQYNLQKTQNYFKTQNVFLFFMSLDIDSKTQLKQKHFFLKYDLVPSLFLNSEFKIFLKTSIFKNFAPMVAGSSKVLRFKKDCGLKLNLKDLTKNNPDLIFFGIRINKKFYCSYQLRKSFSLNYKKNINIFHRSLVTNLVSSYSKLSLVKNSK